LGKGKEVIHLVKCIVLIFRYRVYYFFVFYTHVIKMEGKVFLRKRVIEEYGYVLDVFEGERIIRFRTLNGQLREKRFSGLIGQIVGEECFTLMEFEMNRNSIINQLDRVYIGKGLRNKAIRFLRIIDYSDLTYRARENIPKALEKSITLNEEKWVNFYNTAGPLSMRTHTLELLKSIGKKRVFKIIEERQKREFDSFKDIYDRVGVDPVKALVNRIIEEMTEEQHYYILICGRRY